MPYFLRWMRNWVQGPCINLWTKNFGIHNSLFSFVLSFTYLYIYNLAIINLVYAWAFPFGLDNEMIYQESAHFVSLQKECSNVTADRWSRMSFPLLLQAPSNSSMMQPTPVSSESSETANTTASQCSKMFDSLERSWDSEMALSNAGRIFG